MRQKVKKMASFLSKTCKRRHSKMKIEKKTLNFEKTISFLIKSGPTFGVDPILLCFVLTLFLIRFGSVSFPLRFRIGFVLVPFWFRSGTVFVPF